MPVTCPARHLRRGELPDGGGLRGVADQPERLGCAAAHEHRRVIGQRLRQRGHGRFVRDQPERERRHLTHVRIGVVQRAAERRDAGRQTDAADAERGAPADARVGIGQQLDQIGRGERRRSRVVLSALPHHDGRRRRGGRGVGEDPLILQTDDPPDLRFIADGRRRRRRRGLAAGQADARQRKGQSRTAPPGRAASSAPGRTGTCERRRTAAWGRRGGRWSQVCGWLCRAASRRARL